MKKIKKGIVFSNDIERILKGVNALDYQYDKVPSGKMIQEVREDFARQVNGIFDAVTIVLEEEMMQVNDLIQGDYPHCIFG
ncbi:MAG: hypothetical protein IKF71_03580 [Bacilli bacterium]|nr:hypothetical protein [Bacilli bacterium]